eukprot:211400-Pyramimonas_sp.AAC.1
MRRPSNQHDSWGWSGCCWTSVPRTSRGNSGWASAFREGPGQSSSSWPWDRSRRGRWAMKS